jgi:hypothetical protein
MAPRKPVRAAKAQRTTNPKDALPSLNSILGTKDATKKNVKVDPTRASNVETYGELSSDDIITSVIRRGWRAGDCWT